MPDAALIFADYTIVASPAGAAETIIGSVPGVTTPHDLQQIKCAASANLTIEAATTQVIARLRRGGLTGTQVGVDWVTDVTGGNIVNVTAQGIDSPQSLSNGTYVLTVRCTSAAGAATVHAVAISARVD